MMNPLDQLAARVVADPFFLAPTLAEYARSEQFQDDAQLAAALGCRIEDLARLRLCRAPRPDGNDFRSDLTAIATRFGLDLVTLTRVVRRGQSIVRVREASSAQPSAGPMLAARDQDQPPTTEDAP